MKILFLILDGLGDRPIRELGNKTPLEAAKTPHLDLLVKNGAWAKIIPTYRGAFPTSKDSHLSLFGYNLARYKRMGRGAFEAIGVGIKLRKDEVALRGNFATVDENLKIIDRRAGRIKDTSSLVQSLQGINIKGVRFILKKSSSHRLVVIMRGKGISEEISDGDQHQISTKAAKIFPLSQNKSAIFTAEVLNDFLAASHRVLSQHPLNRKRQRQGLFPANYILLREAGIQQKIPSFYSRWKMKAACVAGGKLYQAIGRILGMEVIKVKGATALANTNIAGKFKASARALKNHNFVFCHLKATDLFSHDGDFLGKKKFIEKIDGFLPLLSNSKKTILVITGDHSTPCKMKEHSADPNPAFIFGVQEKGNLGKIKGLDFLKRVVKMRM